MEVKHSQISDIFKPVCKFETLWFEESFLSTNVVYELFKTLRFE
jgi:hypothetical protein